MVTHPTVLIIGAGASAPYGFPTAAGLVSRLITDLRFARQGVEDFGLTDESRILLRAGFSAGLLREFVDQLKSSKAYSPDVFLERRAEFAEVGKAAIASILMPCEDESTLNPANGNWYRYFLDRLSENLSAGAKAPLTIVTYNYDRSLEHYLYQGFRSLFGSRDERSDQILHSLRFIHLHGSFGLLPWQSGAAGSQPLAFGAPRTVEALQEAARRIKIIHEDVQQTPEYTEARNAMMAAERICFLGFGYHRVNSSRLTYGNWVENPLPGFPFGRARTLVGSAFGLTKAEANQRAALFDTRSTKNVLRLGDPSDDCLQFLREHVWVIS